MTSSSVHGTEMFSSTAAVDETSSTSSERQIRAGRAEVWKQRVESHAGFNPHVLPLVQLCWEIAPHEAALHKLNLFCNSVMPLLEPPSYRGGGVRVSE